jgi:CRISPR/Cas system-associated endoribonuclease Cas2
MTKNAEKLESASKNTCKRIKKRVFAGELSTVARAQVYGD